MLEKIGIVPKFSVDCFRYSLKKERDTWLETAIEVAKAL